MIGMVTRLASISAVALALVLPAGVATAHDYPTAVAYRDIGKSVRLSRLSRQFMAATPYVVNFDFDKYFLDEEAREKLDAQALWINSHPMVIVGVFGHTDLMGSNDYNMWLGRKRAETVIAYLVSRGVHRDQVVLTESMGEESPIFNVVEKNRDNRRATTYVYGIIPASNETRTAGATVPSVPDTTATVTTASTTGATSVDSTKGVSDKDQSKKKPPVKPDPTPTPPPPPPPIEPDPVVHDPIEEEPEVEEEPEQELVCRRVEREGQWPRFVEICEPLD